MDFLSLKMIAGFMYLVGVLLLTTGVGGSFIASKKQILSRISLAFPLGFCIISLSGIIAKLVGIHIFLIQLLIVSTSLIIFIKKGHYARFRRSFASNKMIFAVVSLYMLACIFFLFQMPAWASGDMEMHALRLRLFLDDGDMPVSVYPFGSYWEYYPKAFYFYCYFWLNLLPISLIDVLKVVPVAITGFTSLCIYGLTRQFTDKNTAVYALVFATFLFAPHYAYLIWGGYPAAAGELILMSFFLSLFVDRRLSGFFIVALVMTHTSYVVYAAIILGCWLFLRELVLGRNKRLLFAATAIMFFSVIVIVFVSGSLHSPVFVESILSDHFQTLKYALLWIPGVVAFPSIWKTVKHRRRGDLFFLCWVVVILGFALAVDTGLIDFSLIAVDRILITAYIPLSVFAGMTVSGLKGGRYALILLASIGLIVFSGVFLWYIHNWALPEPDFEAIMWLKNQGFENTAVFNMDSTGRWIYPLTGLPVSVTKESYRRPWWYGIRGEIAKGPMRATTIRYMDEMKDSYSHVLIYLSNMSTTRPGFQAPFLRNNEGYSTLTTEDFSSEYYRVLYAQDGAYVFEFIGNST